MEALRRQQPLIFFDQASELPPFRLAVGRAIFPRGRDEVILETYVSVRPLDGFSAPVAEGIVPVSASGAIVDSLAQVEWALYDENERRIDYRREPLSSGLRRSRLHRALSVVPLVDDGDDPFVLPIGARLEPGLYRMAVEVTGPHGRGRDALVLVVDIPSGVPEGILSMSDLELATAFRPYRPGSDLPLRFVKYGQAVVPVPDLRLPVATPSVSVYFELRHLALDDQGRTRFDVSYEVFQSDREILNLTLGGDFKREDLDRIDPLTLTFLEETTGTAPGGVVVKGADVDISSLGRGDYVLVVTVRDRLSDRSESQAVPFRKQG
jgi:hypothetical protein